MSDALRAGTAQPSGSRPVVSGAEQPILSGFYPDPTICGWRCRARFSTASVESMADSFPERGGMEKGI